MFFILIQVPGCWLFISVLLWLPIRQKTIRGSGILGLNVCDYLSLADWLALAAVSVPAWWQRGGRPGCPALQAAEVLSGIACTHTVEQISTTWLSCNEEVSELHLSQSATMWHMCLPCSVRSSFVHSVWQSLGCVQGLHCPDSKDNTMGNTKSAWNTPNEMTSTIVFKNDKNRYEMEVTKKMTARMVEVPLCRTG